MFNEKPILFPEIKNLSELFTNIVEYSELRDCQNARKYIELKSNNNELEEIEPISNTVMIDQLNAGFKHITFDFNSSIIPELTTKLENGVNLSGYIKFVQRDDLSTLIIFEYDHIIGSFYLALIPFEGMPDNLKPIPFKNVASDKRYTTHIQHLQHNTSLDRLVELFSLYSVTDFSTSLDDLNNWDRKSIITIHGNFEAFALCYRVATNDPELVGCIAYAINSCENKTLSENARLTNITQG